MDINKSLICIDFSNIIKGILIFLIILGHNMIFTYTVESIKGMGYLYCFHIQSFFLLPFLYGSKQLTSKRLVDYWVRLYWPFMLLSLFLYIGYYIIYLNNEFDFNFFYVWFTGDVFFIKKYCGLQILWFMPSMFILMVLKDVYYYSNKKIKLLLISFSVFIYVYSIITPYKTILLPFGLYHGVKYLFLGVLCRVIIKRYLTLKKSYSFQISIIFTILSIIYFYNSNILYNNIITKILCVSMPLVFILLLFANENLLKKATFFFNLGKYSFSIYLIHPFIGYVLYFLFTNLNLRLSLFYSIIAQIIMVVIPYCLSVEMYKITWIKKLLFSRSYNELKSLFCRYEKEI